MIGQKVDTWPQIDVLILFYEAHMWLVKRLTHGPEIENSSVNEWTTQPFNHAYFQKLFSNIMKTTHYNNS